MPAPLPPDADQGVFENEAVFRFLSHFSKELFMDLRVRLDALGIFPRVDFHEVLVDGRFLADVPVLCPVDFHVRAFCRRGNDECLPKGSELLVSSGSTFLVVDAVHKEILRDFITALHDVPAGFV